MDMATGKIQDLTHNTGFRETLPPDRQFYENDYDNIQDDSVIVHSETGNVYFVQGRKICRVNVNGEIKLLSTIPDGMASSVMHVNRAGTKLLIATSDTRA